MHLRCNMRIKITKSLVIKNQDLTQKEEAGSTFPVGEYPANLTSSGKIEIIATGGLIIALSFSEFREKISLGEFIVLGKVNSNP